MKLTEKKIRWTIFLLFLLIVINVFFIREFSNKPLLIGGEPYYHLRISESLLESGFVGEDKFVYGWRPYLVTPYHLFLFLGAIFFDELTTAIVLPLIVGFLSLVFLYLILTKLNFGASSKLVFMVFYVLSPIFLYTLFITHSAGTAFLLQLIGFLLYLSQKRNAIIFSFLFFSAASLFGPSYMLATIVILGLYSFYDRKKLPHFYALIFIFSLIGLLIYIPFIQEEGFMFFKLTGSYLINFIVDFGAEQGISIFALALSVLGFLRLWNRKKHTLIMFMFLFLVATVFFGIYHTYTNLAVSLFASLGFIYISKRSWKLQKLKGISIALILICLFFSANSYAIRLAESPPNSDLIDGLKWLKDNSLKESFIFSDINNGFWIGEISERPVIWDSLSQNKLSQKKEEMELLINSYDLRKAQNLLQRYNIQYLVVTKDMLNKYGEKGLFYLLKNNETFKKVYGNDHLGIYLVKDQGGFN